MLGDGAAYLMGGIWVHRKTIGRGGGACDKVLLTGNARERASPGRA